MKTLLSLSLFLLVLATPLPVLAHEVHMFANVEGSKVIVEGYFSDGKKATNATVQVFGPDGERLLQGKADEAGLFSFDVPQETDLRISLYAGLGHRTETTIPAAEVRGALVAAEEDEASVAAVDPAAMKAIVQQAVGEALTPVMRNISELKAQKTFSDIIGGIGFIIGAFGVFFYLKGRRERDSVNRA